MFEKNVAKIVLHIVVNVTLIVFYVFFFGLPSFCRFLNKAVIICLPDASGSGFGVNDSKTLKNVMDKTGCKIEMSSSKDQTLTFLITGSEAEFRKAKAELTAQFQVCFLVTVI